MKLPKFLTIKKERKKTGSFAEFFLHAPEKEKRRVFEDAARLANKDQRALVENINKLQHKTS
ncbi:MAG: hypothetical protein A2469_04055 [Candidatus Magasanikbacteria bacterium RIFOXYC2_FULL_40_16]|uniref:Uncharacterized protein n=3 Tax=Candidatus Magasanikiibacteriota TaxID=1752731 RepID=A0A1F6NG22_9BACT|nr:MAG: hypothetical protein A2224_00910 [Candidatus Magasanikbacteria bacterium RIFOXYA2_FULL_40_20]OGH82801.1 MAG: hypothetical protein A2373_01015 [Candidatus Magasanikbacteria bacterium RIFOXYB1_FULL_40_15]OGH86986.1 MAG: hypothetical protein A2301_01620 [Candidatus Magasanikbacteria bacterium RIFOXYB2_FULL_40_13]OGH87920.1 MAG: hypothetical protein A2206_03670 [Candidatus Magasanikbacteria bacterium RIFOXYA1_FULL_40_8]OGH89796.1 MAG: hypothetical protein A2469_04055 [Candidatus Magasanikba